MTAPLRHEAVADAKRATKSVCASLDSKKIESEIFAKVLPRG